MIIDWIAGIGSSTLSQLCNLGRGGAARYARRKLRKAGVTILESWAVPPPAGSTL